MRRALCLLLPLLLLFFTIPTAAHANLARSEPAANTRLNTAPDEIRLFFTEPLEANFSRIDIQNSQGQIVDLPPSQVDPDDNLQLFIVTSTLPDGLYTIIWRVVSQTDGHLTQGSFPLTIGSAMGVAGTVSSLGDENIPIESALIRFLNLLSLAWWVGCVGFFLFIWFPTLPEGHPETEQRMNRMINFAWVAVGISSTLMLLLQTSIVAGSSLLQSMDAVPSVLLGTRFGQLWIWRGLLWIVAGIIPFFMQNQVRWKYRLLLILGMGMLITQSLFSHASGATDAVPSVIADVLHLLAMAVWIGGLAQFIVVIFSMRQMLSVLAVMVAHFSNMARLAVAMLVITGVYAAWLHIGSLDGFIKTAYGRLMLLKLGLFLPLLLLGAINLIFTRQGLQAGNKLWSKRLRYLVMLEVTLTLAIIAAVGAMTAIAPARTTVASRTIVPPPDYTYFDMGFESDLMIHLTIEPGTVGDNTFYVDLFNADSGELLTDASLIRLRFEPENADIGESELRPTLQENGRYVVEGSNLSIAGAWRIRMTVQRPGQFDSVVDFVPTINLAEPLAISNFDPTPPVNMRAFALVLTGLAGIIAAGLALFFKRPLTLNPQTILTLIFLVGSIIILQSGLQILMMIPTVTAETIGEFEDNTPTRMVMTSTFDAPFLLTKAGTLLRFDNSSWQVVDFDVPIQDIYLQNGAILWAATANGLYRYADDTWTQESTDAISDLVSTHGYLFTLGMGEILRVPEGGIETESRLLAIPESAVNATEFEMLGNHTHVLLNGEAVYMTESLGLGWQALDAPAAIQHIAIDADGHLLAVSDDALLRWKWTDAIWETVIALPENASIDVLTVFERSIFLLIQGQVYQLNNAIWEQVDFGEDAYITDVAVQYPHTIWALDANPVQLWQRDSDSANWQVVPIVITQ